MRNFSCIQMVVSDIDGTLVPKGDRISERLYESVRQLKADQIHFTLATGRSWRQTRDLVKALDVTLPVVVQSGALIVDPRDGAIIERVLVPPVHAESLWEIPMQSIDWFHLGLDGVYSAKRVNTPEGQQLQSYLGEQCHIVGEKVAVNLKDSVKLLGVGAQREISLLQKRIKQVYPEGRQIIWPGRRRTDGWYIEIFAPQAHKAQAVRRIAQGLGLGMDRVLAFGDGDNDRELIAEAGFGGAIKSASRDIRRTAKYIVDLPEKDGVAKALDRWVFKPKEEMGWKERFMTFIPTRF